MAVLLRLVCPGCGKSRSSTGTPWLRCDACGALCGFDWPAWLDGPGGRAQLEGAAASAPRWTEHGRLVQAAREAWLAGEEELAAAQFEAAAELELELLPVLVPPEAARPGPYRAAILARRAHGLRCCHCDEESVRLQGELTALLHAFDWRAPLATLQAAIPLVSALLRRVQQCRPPPDPDGLPPVAREQIDLGFFLGGYAGLLGPEDRARLWGMLYGEGAVRVTQAEEDEGGLFGLDRCPGCGLPSLQPRASSERTCPGCMGRWAAPAELPAIDASCSGCGAPLSFAAGAREQRCGSCSMVTTRSPRDWENERAFARLYGAPEPPQDFTPGLPVRDADERLARWLDGLARQIAWYGPLLPPARLASVVSRALPDPAQHAALRARLAEEGAAAEASWLAIEALLSVEARGQATQW